MSSDNAYVIRASAATNRLIVNQNGDTTISGTSGVQGLSIISTSAGPIEINNTMHNGPYLVAIPQSHNNNDLLFALRCRPLNQLWCFGVATSNQYIISHENSTKFSIQSNGNTTTGGNLDAGTAQAVTSIKAYVNHAGRQGNVEIEARWHSQGFTHFNTTNPDGLLLIAAKDDLCLYCGLNIRCFYKPTTNAPDDRLKENDVIIESACETLSKLTPQLYDKKPDMENNDPKTLHKESGLIAQEIYYKEPELMHLVHIGKPEFDEEGNSIPLPEIPSSIDPSEDPDYSSWGKEPASLTYIGLIAYLVKSNNELHERVNALGG